MKKLVNQVFVPTWRFANRIMRRLGVHTLMVYRYIIERQVLDGWFLHYPSPEGRPRS
jgi:hypothetical protein